MEGYRCQLDDRVRRVLFSGAGEPHRILPIHYGAVENHSRSHNARRVFRFFRDLPARAVSMELQRRVYVSRRGSVLHVL